MSGEWVYLRSSRRNGTLYVGVMSDLERRVGEQRGFTSASGLKRPVWFDRHDRIDDAIERKRNIKHWLRAWRVRLIHRENAE